MSNRLHKALLDIADPARKLADALEEFRTGGPQYVTNVHGDTFEIEPEDMRAFGIERGSSDSSIAYAARTVIDPAHAHLIAGAPTDRAIMEDLQQRTDELLHAIDLARTTITGAIPLQTLDLVRPKVKDVLANLAGTIEKDMKP